MPHYVWSRLTTRNVSHDNEIILLVTKRVSQIAETNLAWEHVQKKDYLRTYLWQNLVIYFLFSLNGGKAKLVSMSAVKLAFFSISK